MAATLTDELTRVSVAEIEKWDEGPDGTVYVYGRCTTPEVDTDDQVVDSGWSGPALKEYLASAPTVRVQHNAQRDPAGSAVRVDVNRDGDGAHWLKAAVDEPIAARLVKRGHLRAFSVGIARPVIERDISGKARGGIIKGGKIVEVSLVDSPANRSCFLEIAKSAADGTAEFTGKMVADDDVIQKALGADLLTKGADDGFVNVDLPPGASISISPADFAKLRTFKQDLVAKTAGADTEKRDVSTAERRDLASEGNALPDGSYPIDNTGDLHNAAHLARTGHGDAAAARRLIARRARELGVANPLDEGDSANKSDGEVTVNVTMTGSSLNEEQLTKAVQDGILRESHRGRTTGISLKADAAKEAEPDLTKSCSKCSGGDCDGASCSCGKCTDGTCACGKAAEKSAGEPEQRPVKKAKNKKKKQLPPWLNQPKDGDGDDGKDDDASKVCKSVTDHLWTGIEGTSDIVCSKCHTTPAQAAGVTATPMDPAPVKELLESDGPASIKGATPASASGAVAEHMDPVPRHREPDGAPMEAMEKDSGLSDGDDEKPARLEAATGMKSADLAPDPEVAALLRFKATGADEDLGRLHDLTCPAFHPEQVAKYHPYADLGTLIDSGAWQRKTLAAAAGPLEAALKAQETWQAALLLKTADPADINDWRLELHKAFRDANPGPGSFPTPGCVSPMRYSRPVLTDGRAANATDYDGPNSSPQVATTAPDAHSFDRPPLSAGHQSPSPSFMKASFEYPGETGVPTQLSYAAMQKEQQRQALVRMHEHLARQFPPMCPIGMDGPAQAENHPVPQPAGIGKGEDLVISRGKLGGDEGHKNGYTMAIDPAPAAALKAEPEQDGLFADADIYKGFKKMRKKLGKKVLAGKMTVDEARAHLGRQFTQKGADEPQEAVQKGVTLPPEELARLAEIVRKGVSTPEEVRAAPLPALPVAASFDPEVIKTAVADATSELKDLLVKQQETFTTKLAEQQRVIDAIADQPDPSTAAFSGLAYQPQVIKSRRPAAIPDIAESAARAQDMIRRNLQHTYQTHSDPHVREAASGALASLGVGMEAPPMT